METQAFQKTSQMVLTSHVVVFQMCQCRRILQKTHFFHVFGWKMRRNISMGTPTNCNCILLSFCKYSFFFCEKL